MCPNNMLDPPPLVPLNKSPIPDIKVITAISILSEVKQLLPLAGFLLVIHISHVSQSILDIPLVPNPTIWEILHGTR